MADRIDFVISWVDGSDKEWQQKKSKYCKSALDEQATAKKSKVGNTDEVRFRDSGTLRYLFRSIELFAPWVNHVYLVTDGQVPAWLDTSNPKVTVVDHKDFIPMEYLPTFNSHTIELNLFRIKGLAKQFVYFTDDVLIANLVDTEDFFVNGLPVHEASLNGINGQDEQFARIQFSNMCLMNRHYSIKDVRRHLTKWLKPSYGKNVIRTWSLLPFKRLQGIFNPHGPLNILTQTCEKMWERDEDVFDATCQCKTRQGDNISPFVFRYEQLLSGQFVPRRCMTKYCEVSESTKHITRALAKYKFICINDVPMPAKEYDKKQKKLESVLEKKYAFVSSFEKA